MESQVTARPSETEAPKGSATQEELTNLEAEVGESLLEPHRLISEINKSIKEEEDSKNHLSGGHSQDDEEATELKRPSTGRKKPRQVWGVNAINFAPGRKMPTTFNVDELIDDKSPARCETEPDVLPSAPSRKIGNGMPLCFGI